MKNNLLKFGIFSILLFMSPVLNAQHAVTDWPNLARFRDENTKLGNPQPTENRVVFMGNSITEGWSQISPGFFEDGLTLTVV